VHKKGHLKFCEVHPETAFGTSTECPRCFKKVEFKSRQKDKEIWKAKEQAMADEFKQLQEEQARKINQRKFEQAVARDQRAEERTKKKMSDEAFNRSSDSN
jgi:hypothetical protein